MNPRNEREALHMLDGSLRNRPRDTARYRRPMLTQERLAWAVAAAAALLAAGTFAVGWWLRLGA